ncbi:Uncharacterised protein [uncultured archaeon]|nr:Uncharacterised protein [uncultured archaeon]
MTNKQELTQLIGEENLRKKIEEKKTEFYNLINDNLAIKLIAKEEGIDSKTILVLETIKNEKQKEYNCIDEKGYFTLVILEQKQELTPGRIYNLTAYKQEQNNVRRTYSTKILPRELQVTNTNLGGNRILIGIPKEVIVKEYKKCYKCTDKNCNHEKETKKRAIITINENRVIVFDYKEQNMKQQICFVGTEKQNALTGEMEIIAKKII